MKNHFDFLEDYDAEIPNHIRDYLAVRKTNFIIKELKVKFRNKPIMILDAGCGTGWHSKILSKKRQKTHFTNERQNKLLVFVFYINVYV